MEKKKDPMCPPKSTEPHVLCGAKTKRGSGTCKHMAGSRTDHPGSGKCWLHGGATPPKHGRYSSITRPRIAELLAKFEADPDPLNLQPEVSLLRALVLDYIERHDALTDAILAWHASFEGGYLKACAEAARDGQPIPDPTPAGKPRQVPDIASVGKLVADIGSLVDKMQKQRQEGVISIGEVNRVLEVMAMEAFGAINEVVTDADTHSTLIAELDRRWAEVRINPISGAKRAP